MFLAIVHHYLVWHYSQAFLAWWNIWRNFLWFIVHFFSLPELLRSWFSPWKRITEKRRKAWDLEEIAGAILINILSRIIGAIMRTIVIVLGLGALVFTIIGGLLVYTIWMSAPILIVVLFIMGVVYLI